MRVVTKVLTSHKFPLIRPSVRTGAPSPKGEGFGSAQIGRNLVLCGTFEYIYWEFGRSASVGGRAAQCAAPTAETWQARAARRVVAPYRVVCGQRAGEDTRPYGDCGGKTAGAQCAPLQERAREPAPSSAPFGGTFPLGGRLKKNKKGQVWDLSLKTQRRNAVSHKISLLTFFQRK